MQNHLTIFLLEAVRNATAQLKPPLAELAKTAKVICDSQLSLMTRVDHKLLLQNCSNCLALRQLLAHIAEVIIEKGIKDDFWTTLLDLSKDCSECFRNNF